MTIPIHNRIVLIVGPTTSGKSTMAKKIQEQFQGTSVIVSHDEVFYKVNQNQPQYAIDLEFQILYISAIKEAILDQQNQLVIIDGMELLYKNVLETLNHLREIGYEDRITLLKTDLPIDLHLLFCEQRDDDLLRRNTTHEELHNTILKQSSFYHSSIGSLYSRFEDVDECIIKDPREVQFIFSFGLETPHGNINRF